MTSRSLSRRQALAVVAMTPGAALGSMPEDPAIAAIERHRQALQAVEAADGPPSTLDQLAEAESDTLLAWLKTQPTTLAGIIATLEYASRRRDEEGNGDYVYANLAHSSAGYDFDGSDNAADIVAAGEAFPAMIAAALRKIAGS